jgi:DNA-damage-inducible protein D
MTKNADVANLFASFEERRFDFNGIDSWRARDLMGGLGYRTWEGFRDVISRAWQACESAGIETALNFLVGDGSHPWSPEGVFRQQSKNPQGGRPSEDVILSRRAAYLVAMNGDPSKPEIGFAQQYFAASTRTLEVIEQKVAESARLQARDRLTDTEKTFQGVLYEHDVDGPGISRIRSKGDRALFGGNDTETMKRQWKVPSKRPLADFAPEVIIIAKQFATAITTHNVKANSLRGEAKITHEHLANNQTVRSGLQQRGIVPELLQADEDIKKVERRHASDAKKLAGEGRAKKKL